MKKNNQPLSLEQYGALSKKFDQKLLKIPVTDYGESFVDLKKLFKKNSVPISFAENPNTIYFSRKSVADSLLKAAQHFEKQGYVLKIESAYRKLSIQKQFFLKRVSEMRVIFPAKSEAEILLYANTYTAGIPILAAHTAGAAVDVTLLDQNHQPLDFGVPYNYGGAKAVTNFPSLSENVLANRKLLQQGMEKFGLINYPFEYWHFSLGDVCETHLAGKKLAIYEPVEFDQISKKIKNMPAQDHYEFFKTTK